MSNLQKATARQHIHSKEINLGKGQKHSAAIQCNQPSPWIVDTKVMVCSTQTNPWEKGVIAKVFFEEKAYDAQLNRAVHHRMEQHIKPYQPKPKLPTLWEEPENDETTQITITEQKYNLKAPKLLIEEE